jgi:hypothetical protein
MVWVLAYCCISLILCYGMTSTAPPTCIALAPPHKKSASIHFERLSHCSDTVTPQETWVHFARRPPQQLSWLLTTLLTALLRLSWASAPTALLRAGMVS